MKIKLTSSKSVAAREVSFAADDPGPVVDELAVEGGGGVERRGDGRVAGEVVRPVGAVAVDDTLSSAYMQAMINCCGQCVRTDETATLTG